SERTTEDVGEIEVTSPDELSPAARRLRAGHDAHSEEAEFCPAQSRKSAVDEWRGSDCLHSRRRAQLAGALDRARARGTSKRFAGRALSYCARIARLARCRWTPTQSLQIWSEAPEGWRGWRGRRSKRGAGR